MDNDTYGIIEELAQDNGLVLIDGFEMRCVACGGEVKVKPTDPPGTTIYSYKLSDIPHEPDCIVTRAKTVLARYRGARFA